MKTIDGAGPKWLARVGRSAIVRARLDGNVDLESWTKKQEKRLVELEKQISQADSKLKNVKFIASAPPAVIEEEKRRLVDFGSQRQRLVGILSQFK